MLTRMLKPWQVVVVGVWVALALAAIYERGQQLGIDRNVTSRLRFHALPVAISVLYHGRPHDYTAYKTLAMEFQTTDPIDGRIAWAVDTYKPPDADDTYYWVADNRGMADYVIAAFELFGPRAQSLYAFYFVVLGISALLFLLDVGRHPALSATLIFALGALYVCLSVVPLGYLIHPTFEPGALYEPRLFELLAYVATLHLAAASFVDDRWSRRRIALVGAQAAILAATYHARSSVGWEVVFVLIAGATVWIRQIRSARRLQPPLPLVCVVVAFAVVAGYQRAAFNPRYFQDMGSRTIWHNALMGLSANQHLNRRYGLDINDRAVAYAVMAYLRDTQDPRLTADWTGENILGSLGGHASFNWSVFENAARDFYWHLWRTDTASMLRCYLIDKPYEAIGIVWRAWQVDSDIARHNPGLSFRPLSLGSLLIVLPGLLLAWGTRAAFRPSLAAAIVLLACSVVPALFFYPVVHTMMGVFATIALLLYLTLAALVAVLAPDVPVPRVLRLPSSRLEAMRRRLPRWPATGLRLERVEPALALGLAALTCVTCAYFAPRGFRAGFADMAHDGYQLRQVLDLDRGGTIFKDTFDQYGPLSGYLNLVSFRLLGGTLLAVKYGAGLWYAATAVLLYRLGRRLLTPGLSAVAVLVWLALGPFYQHGVMISPHVYLLFFQAVAVLAVIRFAETDHLKYLALAGVCCGLGWALKTSMGVLFAAGVIGYLLSRPLRGVSTARRAGVATATIAGCAALVAASLLTWLWTRGALHDWYLQTVAFPRSFYFAQSPTEREALMKLPFALTFLWGFVLLNLGVTSGVVVVAFYWHLMRLLVLLAAAVQWRRGAAPEALFVTACVTPMLWLGAYPSANYMHQWWTASLTIPAFVYAVRGMVEWVALRWSAINARRVGWVTAVIVFAVVSPGMIERVATARERARTLTERVEAPPHLRGIRTDRQTAAAFRAIYGAILNFKRHHPSARVVSNDHCDGFSNCVAESLLWLSFLDDNPHDHPVYWPLPVLTTHLYPDYDARFWDGVERTRPLIVDSWPGNYLPEKGIDGYQLLVGVASEHSYWYVFAPIHPEAPMHGELPVRLDRPRALSQPGTRRLFDTALDPATGAARSLPLYTWPGDLDVPATMHEPRPIDEGATDARAPIVASDSSRWMVRGEPESRHSDLLAFKEAPIADGEYFLATGDLDEGGLAFHLFRDEESLGLVIVQRPGPFAVMLKPPGPGRYRVVLASHIDTTWWQVLERYGIAGLGRLKSGATMFNAFRVDRAGWVTPTATTPVAFAYRRPSHSSRMDADGRAPADSLEPKVGQASGIPVDAAVKHVPIEGERREGVDPDTGVKRDLYLWPAGLSTPSTFGNPRILDPEMAETRAAIVKTDGGRWIVRGSPGAAYSYLVQFGDEPVRRGDYFLATGHLDEGGFTVGLLNGGKWAGFVNVDTPGPFAVMLMPLASARYSLVLANYDHTKWWQFLGRHGAPGLVKLMTGDWRPIALQIDRAGWVTRDE